MKKVVWALVVVVVVLVLTQTDVAAQIYSKICDWCWWCIECWM